MGRYTIIHAHGTPIQDMTMARITMVDMEKDSLYGLLNYIYLLDKDAIRNIIVLDDKQRPLVPSKYRYNSIFTKGKLKTEEIEATAKQYKNLLILTGILENQTVFLPGHEHSYQGFADGISLLCNNHVHDLSIYSGGLRSGKVQFRYTIQQALDWNNFEYKHKDHFTVKPIEKTSSSSSSSSSSSITSVPLNVAVSDVNTIRSVLQLPEPQLPLVNVSPTENESVLLP